MALKAPDMESCNIKQRCLNGPNKGLAYDPGDPCTPGETFNSLTCDCDPPILARSVWHADEIAYSYFECGYSCDGFPVGDCSVNSGTCSNEIFGVRSAIDFTTSPGLTPHELVYILSDYTLTTPGCKYDNQCNPGDNCYPSSCVSGFLGLFFRIRASDGTWITDRLSASGVSGTFCLGQNSAAMCSGYPEIVEYIPV